MVKKFNVVSYVFGRKVVDDLSSIYIQLNKNSDYGKCITFGYLCDSLEHIFKNSRCQDSFKYFIRYSYINEDIIILKLGIDTLLCNNEVKEYICKRVTSLLYSIGRGMKHSVSAILMYGNKEHILNYACADEDYNEIKNAWTRAYADYVLFRYDSKRIMELTGRIRYFVVSKAKYLIQERMLGNLDDALYDKKLSYLDWAYNLYRYIEDGQYVSESIKDIESKLIKEISKRRM